MRYALKASRISEHEPKSQPAPYTGGCAAKVEGEESGNHPKIGSRSSKTLQTTDGMEIKGTVDRTILPLLLAYLG
jgi:hypothetical protein